MKEGPDIASVASLIGDPGRANMLAALMSGKALTATELALEAGITPQTASSHLARLEAGGLISPAKQGRHKYFTLTDDAVADALEALMGLAARRGHLRTRTGPRDPALRQARVCYNHLAGERGVQLYDSLRAREFLVLGGEGLCLSATGSRFFADLGMDVGGLSSARGPMCRECLDWSIRRMHLAGSLGRATLARVIELGWARREPDSRAVTFSDSGRAAFDSAFPP